MSPPTNAAAQPGKLGEQGRNARDHREYSTSVLDITSTLEMALAYAGHGWHVFPTYSVVDGVCNCYKGADCRQSGKHPRTRDGFLSATTDEAKIRRWWGMWPVSNVAIRTGIESNLVVIDIDPKNGGLETVAALQDAGKSFVRTAQVLTQSDGFHLYYQHPGGKVACSAGLIGPGIDVRGDGGYALAPPSRGPMGEYVWQVAVEDLAVLE